MSEASGSLRSINFRGSSMALALHLVLRIEDGEIKPLFDDTETREEISRIEHDEMITWSSELGRMPTQDEQRMYLQQKNATK
jgi:hypothetical protein